MSAASIHIMPGVMAIGGIGRMGPRA